MLKKIMGLFKRTERCPNCGAKLKLTMRWSGEKEGNRYWICSTFPSCKYKRMFAEQGKPLGPWELVGRLFVKR